MSLHVLKTQLESSMCGSMVLRLPQRDSTLSLAHSYTILFEWTSASVLGARCTCVQVLAHPSRNVAPAYMMQQSTKNRRL